MLKLFIRKVVILVSYPVPFKGLLYKYHMLKRDLCPKCNKNLVAVNYISGGVRHYRNKCASCIRKDNKIKEPVPLWARTGYRKKERCEVCGFKAKTLRQMFVYYIDGNLKNNNWPNLKTICANCQIELAGSRVSWKPAPLVPDF